MLDRLRTAPYWDDYDSSKQYTQLLAVPGRVAQAREITQIQSTLKDIIKSVGDSMLKDGNIIEGCQVLPFVEDDIYKVRVTAGKVYINGMVLPVADTILSADNEDDNYTGEGTETIGVKLVEEIILEGMDVDTNGRDFLNDPAGGYANLGKPGCHRLKSSVAVVANESDSAIIGTLIDGELALESYAPEYDVITQTLARRTYDESGSYIVDGLKVRVESHPTDNTKFNVVVESGKAYILGYERKIPAPRRIALPRATTSRNVSTRHHFYDGNDTQISKVPYIKSIIKVEGSKSTTIQQTITSNVSEVAFPVQGVTEVTSVTQGGNTYTVGTSSSGDCYLRIDNTGRCFLAWRGQSTPTLNSNYNVTYTYDTEFIANTDYTLTTNSEGVQYISWMNGGATPLNNTRLYIDYELYQSRKDLVYIDQYGGIEVIQGIPADYGYEILPESPLNTLPLSYVVSPPAGDASNNINFKINVSNIGLTRFTMNDIQDILDRIRTIEYDQAVLSLNDEAKQYETTNDKKGIWTEPFIDASKIDFYYNLSGSVALDSSLPIYDITLDLTSNLAYLPTITSTEDAVYNNISSSSHKYNRTATLAKTGSETVVLSQMNATKSFLINPYSQFPQLPEISIDPAVDVWIDDTIINVPISRNTSQIVSFKTNNIDTYQNTRHRLNATTTTSTTTDTTIGTRVSSKTVEEVIREESIMYIRPRVINVQGSMFPPDLDNIKCYFDGVEVPTFEATGTTQPGSTAPHSVKSNYNGQFTARFTIPNNVKTGIREVRIESDIEIDGYETSAFALYQASGTARTIQRTVNTLTTVLLNRLTTVETYHYYVDPIGQTFVLDSMTMLSGIDLYFESKPTGLDITPVTCDIREVVNGNITSTIYGHKTLYANQVNTTGATRFSFDDPVMLEENKEYAFVVRSTSTNYRLYVAELGENDITTNTPVLSNPYLIGVMMSSSNNSSWTTHQTTDIKFRLIADNYVNSSEIIFNSITPADEFSRIYLLAESVMPNNTSIDWQYSTDDGATYIDITPYSMAVLSQLKHNIVLKAILRKGSNTSLSPIVALDSVGIVVSKYNTISYTLTKSSVEYFSRVKSPAVGTKIYSNRTFTTEYDTVTAVSGNTITGSRGSYTLTPLRDKGAGWYISKLISNLSNYTHIDVILDVYSLSNTSEVGVYVHNGTTMTKATIDSSVDLSTAYWKEVTYKATVSQSNNCKIFIKLSSEYAYETPAIRRVRAIMS